VFLSAAIAAWLAFIGIAARLVLPTEVLARFMPFGFPLRITSQEGQLGAAFSIAVGDSTRFDRSRQEPEALP
jgi:hypothetical protein